MYLKSLILSLALLCLITGGRSKPQCAFSIPTLLKSGEMARGCLDMKRHLESVNVDITLQINGMNITVISEQVPVGNFFKCLEFQVPNVAAAVPVFLTVYAVANDYHYIDRRSIIVAPTGKATLIQLERSIYKPGQTVRGNVIAMDNDLYMTDDTYPAIYVTDPAGNRIFQWLKQETVNGFCSFTFDILEEPRFGFYTITVEQKTHGQVTKTFLVDEYVLINIDVEISAPDSIDLDDKTLSYKVIGKYTYGQGVPGKVTGKLCRPQSYGPYARNACNRKPELCIPITGKLDSEGTLSGNLELALLQFELMQYLMTLDLQITVIVEGSGIQVTESKSIRLTQQSPRVYFNSKNMPSYYKKGIDFYVEVILEDRVGKALSNQLLELLVNGKVVQNLTTGADGKAWDYIDTSEFRESTVQIQVNYKYSEKCNDISNELSSSSGIFSVTRFYSRTGSFVHLEGPKEELQCGQVYSFSAKYIFGQSSLEEGETNVDFIYMAMSRAKIVEYARIPVDLTKSLQGEFNIHVEISMEHVPILDLIVYYMLKDEVVMDTIRLNTEKFFRNQVSLKFSEESGSPGSTVNLDMTADSRSLCAVRVYDSSLLLLHQEEPLTPETVYSTLQYNSLSGYNMAGYNVEPPEPPCIDNQEIFVNGFYYSIIDFPNEADTMQVASNVGLNFYTNMTLGKPRLCYSNNYNYPHHEAYYTSKATLFAGDEAVPYDAMIQSQRTFFPEMWFYGLTNIPENGSFSLPMQVPGTITQWRSDIVCLSYESGFGMTKHPANFTAFQVFFVDFQTPYSIVRGEILILRVQVFNYMNKCVKPKTTLQLSSDYTVEAEDENGIKCICFRERASYSYKIGAKSLGVVSITVTSETVHIGDSCDGADDPNQPRRKDTVVKSVIVESEGIQNEVTKSMYLCVKDSEAMKGHRQEPVIPISITSPENVVKDSLKAKVTVIGNILGRALTNPESMIREPTGCGEQNLGTLTMLVTIVDHLNKTGGLSEETKAKAVQLMGNGYRNQLGFRNNDGSFSVFQGSPASSWLTISTLATLQRVKLWTYVEESVLNQILVYVEGLYNKITGAFNPRGTVFNNALKDGVENDVSFTAMVAVVLLQGRYAASPTLLRDALNFLDAASRREQTTYNRAVLYNCFRVAGNEERSNEMFAKLKEVQIEEGGTIHWERPNKPNKKESYIFSSPAGSAEIEITSYVLCGLNARPPQSPEDLTYRSQIALWLSQQQNAYGSYSTTTDSVMAVKALTDYSALVHHQDASNVVQISYENKVIKEFLLDVSNRDFLLSQPLPYIPGNYNIIVSGNGCVLVQTTVNFNIPVMEEDSAFRLSVSTPPESCVDGVAPTIPVYMNISYNGLRNQSNMVLVEVKLPSGYGPEHQSMMELKHSVAKVELQKNAIIIYIDGISVAQVISLHFILEMHSRVLNFQPKPVVAWDYYEKEENGKAVLFHPCAKQ